MKTSQRFIDLLIFAAILSTVQQINSAIAQPAAESPPTEKTQPPDATDLSPSVLPLDTGLTFRVFQRRWKMHYKPAVFRSAVDSITTMPCADVQINLKRGRLEATTSGEEHLISFTDLPPGVYNYEIFCQNSRGINGSSKGQATVVDGVMSPIVVTIDTKEETISDVVTSSMSLRGETISGSYDQKGGDLDSKVRDLTILADLGYVTSRDTHQNVAPLAFTDLGVWSIAAAFTPERRLTFGGKLIGLAKTPASLDVPVMQAAAADVSYAFQRHLAVNAGGQWQTGLGSTKDVLTFGAGLTWRKQHSHIVKTEFSVGAQSVSHRDRESADSNRTSAAAAGAAEVQLCWGPCNYRHGASWFGFDASVPFYHSAKSMDSVGAKPNSALGFHFGSFMKVNKTFDLYADVAWRDRGDSSAAKTETGTLLGGFDQIQLSLGAIFYFHFGKGDDDDDANRQTNNDYLRAL
jgi:hypothetical protein